MLRGGGLARQALLSLLLVTTAAWLAAAQVQQHPANSNAPSVPTIAPHPQKGWADHKNNKAEDGVTASASKNPLTVTQDDCDCDLPPELKGDLDEPVKQPGDRPGDNCGPDEEYVPDSPQKAQNGQQQQPQQQQGQQPQQQGQQPQQQGQQPQQQGQQPQRNPKGELNEREFKNHRNNNKIVTAGANAPKNNNSPNSSGGNNELPAAAKQPSDTPPTVPAAAPAPMGPKTPAQKAEECPEGDEDPIDNAVPEGPAEREKRAEQKEAEENGHACDMTNPSPPPQPAVVPGHAPAKKGEMLDSNDQSLKPKGDPNAQQPNGQPNTQNQSPNEGQQGHKRDSCGGNPNSPNNFKMASSSNPKQPKDQMDDWQRPVGHDPRLPNGPPQRLPAGMKGPHGTQAMSHHHHHREHRHRRHHRHHAKDLDEMGNSGDEEEEEDVGEDETTKPTASDNNDVTEGESEADKDYLADYTGEDPLRSTIKLRGRQPSSDGVDNDVGA